MREDGSPQIRLPNSLTIDAIRWGPGRCVRISTPRFADNES